MTVRYHLQSGAILAILPLVVICGACDPSMSSGISWTGSLADGTIIMCAEDALRESPYGGDLRVLTPQSQEVWSLAEGCHTRGGQKTLTINVNDIQVNYFETSNQAARELAFVLTSSRQGESAIIDELETREAAIREMHRVIGDACGGVAAEQDVTRRIW